MSGQQGVDGPLQSFSDGLSLSKKVYYLAILPFVLDAFFLIGTYIQTEYSYYFRFGAKVSLPAYFPSLTNVYDFPSRPVFQTSLPLPVNDPLLVLLSEIFYTLIVTYVAAGYLGKLNAARLGDSSPFTVLASKYFTRILGYALLWVVIASLEALFILSSVPLAILYVLLLFVVNYFVFLTPFAIIVDNMRFAEALNRSVLLSTSSASKTVPFVMLYLFGTLVISVPVYLILNLRIIGFFIAVAIFAFVGTALVASTLCFYVRITRQHPLSGATSTPSMPSDGHSSVS